MQLTVEQALQQGVAAHKEGKLEAAERLYRAILQSQPKHPDANHNLGLIVTSTDQSAAGLTLFKTALESNPKVEQFWFSYIDALIKKEQVDNAKQVIEQARRQGIDGGKLEKVSATLFPPGQEKNPNSERPSQQQLDSLLGIYQSERFDEAEQLALSMTEEFPEHPFGWSILGATFGQSGRTDDALHANRQAVKLAPQDPGVHSNFGALLYGLGRLEEAEVSLRCAIGLDPRTAPSHNNLGNVLKDQGRLEEAEISYRQAIALNPSIAEAHTNLGIILQRQERLGEAEASFRRAIKLDPDDTQIRYNLGVMLYKLHRLEDAEASYRRAVEIKPDYAEAHNNLGMTLQELGRLNEAESSFRQSIELNPRYVEALWNLCLVEKTCNGVQHWLDQCLIADPTYEKAKLMRAALRFYQGDRVSFDALMESDLKDHAFMRSFCWVFSLPQLPKLYFNRWDFFDAVIKQSKCSRPFYEFGVLRGIAFKYLIKSFRRGYGFDTFEGLPEDWSVGHSLEKAGSYSAEGNVPNIKGGEFIVGKFEDTLPGFFSRARPMASLINFDADLYSSTICALNSSKSVMDKDTVLVFDEFLINESWEQDEFKALNEFCDLNHYDYEVIAISFFSKQVAVKLIGF